MSETVLLYIGTYTESIKFGTGSILNGKGKGIYRFKLDCSNGKIEFYDVTQHITNPSYLAFSPSKRYLYAVNELKTYNGSATGTVSAFSLNANNGDIIFLNKLPTQGTDPCHISTDDTGLFVFVANFMSGSVAVYKVSEDGRLEGLCDFVQHHGSSVNRKRQSGPHAHSVTYDPATELLFVPDLGLDKLIVYQFDKHHGTLKSRDDLILQVTPGAGPRHLEIHPNRRNAYLINELDSTIIVLTFGKSVDKLKVIQTVSLLPDGFTGESTSADIHISPSGDFLFGTNRGHDSIAGFKIDHNTGLLTYIAHTSTGGKTPRNFVIDPTETFLIAANQDSDSIVSFWIDKTSGTLIPTGYSAYVPTPVCIKVLK